MDCFPSREAAYLIWRYYCAQEGLDDRSFSQRGKESTVSIQPLFPFTGHSSAVSLDDSVLLILLYGTGTAAGALSTVRRPVDQIPGHLTLFSKQRSADDEDQMHPSIILNPQPCPRFKTKVRA